MKKAKKLIPAFILAVAAILMVVSFFLPYATAIDKDVSVEYANLSMIDFVKAYLETGQDIYLVSVILFAVIGLFTALTLLFALIRKPIPAIVFVILSAIAYWIQRFYYVHIHLVPSAMYEYGNAYYLFFISAFVVFVSSIWYLCVRNSKTNPPANYNQYPDMPQ